MTAEIHRCCDLYSDSAKDPNGSKKQHAMPLGGRFAGQPIDTSRKHHVVIRNQLPGTSGEPERFVVDYVFHEDQFWTAIIPLDGVDQVFAQAFNFSKARTKWGSGGKEILFDRHGMPKRFNPLVNHLQARITFHADQPIELFPLFKDHEGDLRHTTTDICYSVEGGGPAGYEFSWRNTMLGNLISVHRIMTTTEMVFERLVLDNEYVTESPPLPLSSQQKSKLLETVLRRSQKAGLAEPYYLFRIFGTNNCTSNALQILDSVVDYSFGQRLASWLYRLPLSPRMYLRLRGMDSNPSERKMVKNEFLKYINAPEIRARADVHRKQSVGPTLEA